MSYIPADYGSVINRPTLEGLTFEKSSRGFNHLTTARLLCPASLLAKFDEDPQGYVFNIYIQQRTEIDSIGDRMADKLYKNEEPVTADRMPTFLYDEALLVDKKPHKKAFLRGHLVQRVIYLLELLN